MRIFTRRSLVPALLLAALGTAGCAAGTATSEPAIRVRNHHEAPYAGPIEFRTDLPDGQYAGASSWGEVRDHRARVVVSLAANSEVVLSRTDSLRADASRRGPLAVAAGGEGGTIDLRWNGTPLGRLDLGLVVLPGTDAGPDDVVRAFDPLDISWTEQPGGALAGSLVRSGYRIELTLLPYGGGWLDLRARVTHLDEAAGPAYVALVRRLTVAPELHDVRSRFNGRVIAGANSPDTWSRDFWYSRGVDWTSWKAGDLSMVAVSGFTPAPTIERDGAWVAGSHFYVWERTRRDGRRLYLISEIAGPNPNQARSGYMKVTPYAPIEKGDALELTWRLSVDRDPPPEWEESHLRAFAGARSVTGDSATATVDLGVSAVAFGTSYLPYSTFTENFDYYRTPGLDRETWWPFSARMWSNWRAFTPRMQTDLHIIRAMGFEWVRLHHLELLQQMDRDEALAFLDFFIGSARALGLKVLVDTQGPAEWVSLIAGRYRDVVRRIEVENEVLIPGIKPGAPARWTALYQAAKRAAPETQVFFTSAGNDGTFERLRTLGVPFDRVGLHAYKHGPEWKEALSSHALAVGGYASSLGKSVTLGEFNWKGLTRLSPEARREEFVAVYEAMLAPRAIPEFFQFQFHETIGVNPSIARRSGVRHYETISLDRRPKPEAFELMRLIRKYARPDAPAREVAIAIPEVRLVDGAATAPFTITNTSRRPLSLELSARTFDGLDARVASVTRLSLAPGERAEGSVELRLPAGAAAGTYHHFLEVSYDGKTAYGWGVASNPAAPTFAPEPVLRGRVVYPQGAGVVERVDWTGRPLAVAFGPEAPGLEMEMAYLVGNTLQSATGRPVRISTTADLPDSLLHGGSLILVGTAASNPLIPRASRSDPADAGVILVREGDGGAARLLLTGSSTKAVEAAATDFVLRYWRNAKDAAIRITGMEPGAALGHTARVTDPDPP